MLKIKFLRINLPEGLDSTYQYLVGSPFERDGQSGFDTISFLQDHVEARFTEQTVTKEQVTDPFGDVQEIVAVRYITTEFAIFNFKGTHVLALKNPSRNVNALVKKLSILVGADFYASTITTDIERFGRYVSENFTVHPLIAAKVFASNLTLDGHCTANVELLSTINALSDLKLHFPSQEMQIDRARFSITDHGKKSQLEIKSTGVVGITGEKRKQLEDLVIKFIEQLFN